MHLTVADIERMTDGYEQTTSEHRQCDEGPEINGFRSCIHGERLFVSEFKGRTYYSYENGQRNISAARLIRLAYLLNVPLRFYVDFRKDSF